MKTKHYTLSTFWDSRVMNPKTKESRVMLLIKLPSSKFNVCIPKLKCSCADYDKSYSNKSLSDIQREVKLEISSVVMKAENILDRLGLDASKEQFQRLFKSNHTYASSSKTDAYAHIDEVVKALRADNRFGSAMNIYNAKNSFKTFRPKLNFEDINETFLKEYKKWMIDNGRSVSTVGIFLRALRSIYQGCMKDRIINVDKSPFDGFPVSWTVKSSKDVLYPNQLKALWEYVPITPVEIRAKDFFFLCFSCNGMNFKDVSTLRNKDLKSDRITFIRSKTSTTTQNPREITAYLSDEVKRIISIYKSTSISPNAYLFEIFNECRDAKHHNATFIRYKRKTNKVLTGIGKKLGINRIYLGIARHSFATKLKIEGIPASHISEYLGHANETTTNNYLKQLPSDIHKQMNSTLLNFK